MGNILWSFSTTIRNPERIPGFFSTVREMEGLEWTKQNQMKFQILLIQKRIYVPTSENLSQEQIELLNDYHREMTYEEAEDIFKSKKYDDPPMRGRMSFDPLEKVGLVALIDNKITLTQVGKAFASGEIDFGELFFNALLKQQYPCPLFRFNSEGYCVKPFIAVLHLIKLVNQLWVEEGHDPIGISRDEFGIFCLNIKRYTDVYEIAEKLIDYRKQLRSIVGEKNKKEYSKIYTHSYLREFPELDKKLKDYRDNMIRCLRLTKLIYIRGGGYYIDLEPRRNVEITNLLDTDNGSAKEFTKEEWTDYIGTIDSYTLPWQTEESLIKIQKSIIQDIEKLEDELKILHSENQIYSDLKEANDNIVALRQRRQALESEKTKIDYSDIDKALEIAGVYDAHLISKSPNKPSVELERLSTLALNVIDDAIEIKPNYPLGDDNEPSFTAPRDVPDIECFYDDFNMICEVTMLTTRSQWFNEGQPVMRHLRDFEDRSNQHDNFCIFIAPKIHDDTLNTFWFATKYEYDGKKQKVLPLTISQFQELLNKVYELKEDGKKVYHNQIKSMLEICTDVASLNGSSEWRQHIKKEFSKWIESL